MRVVNGMSDSPIVHMTVAEGHEPLQQLAHVWMSFFAFHALVPGEVQWISESVGTQKLEQLLKPCDTSRLVVRL